MKISFCQDIYQMLCRKYPNRKIYVIGDQHFYHKNIIYYTRGNFSSTLEMNEYIIKLHNETVGKEDIVIFLGDFCFKNSCIEKILSCMNGHKYLVLGNHDSYNLVKNYPLLGFEGVFTTPIKIQDKYLSHEPLVEGEKKDLYFEGISNEFKKNSNGINYHGHIHNHENLNSRIYQNMTCETLKYKPIMIGKTISVCEDNFPLFINSPYFSKILTLLKQKHNIDPINLISDYIYCELLQKSFSHQNEYFICGSFSLLKKYNFISRFSDLDISFIYHSLMSKSKGSQLLKNMADETYESLKQIDGINLRFLKRYPSLRIFEACYTSKNPYFAKCFLDANMIFIDCYRESDFVTIKGKSMIEKFLTKNVPTLLSEYHFPIFESKTLTPEGDIVNLLLQIIFQSGHKEKRY